MAHRVVVAWPIGWWWHGPVQATVGACTVQLGGALLPPSALPRMSTGPCPWLPTGCTLHAQVEQRARRFRAQRLKAEEAQKAQKARMAHKWAGVAWLHEARHGVCTRGLLLWGPVVDGHGPGCAGGEGQPPLRAARGSCPQGHAPSTLPPAP